MRQEYTECELGCPLEVAIDVIGGKWKGVILYQLLDGKRRFNELLRTKAGLSQRMLTRQLRELESAKVIERKVYAEVPPKVEYSLTPLGRQLQPVLEQLQGWGIELLYENHFGDQQGEYLGSE